MNAIGMNPIERLASPRSAADNFEIKVPASIANLGPGFDTLAVAVQLYLSLRVRKMPGRGHLEFRFVDHELRGENHIERAYRSLAGKNFSRLPSLSVEVRGDIPMRAGLGSSAAATVAGLRLYEAVSDALPMETLLSAACALESHPDNAAASLLGGLTVSCQLPDGVVQARRFSWPESLAFVVLTPDVPLATGKSRAVLPECVSRADVVFNLQRLALLLQSLHSGDFSLLRHAMCDRVHQPARNKVVPGLARALQLEHPDLLGICLSGSGPSIVAIAERSHREIAELLGAVYQRSGVGYRIRILEVHQELSEHVRVFRSGLLCC
ncbi:MAG: homoserine kinase [Candidatus Korobacteraceae bacterium]